MKVVAGILLVASLLDSTGLVSALSGHDFDLRLTALDRTLDLNEYGIDINSTFNSLLSPSGVINQFSLSILIQIIFVTGYVISGQ